jgi:PIN domain
MKVVLDTTVFENGFNSRSAEVSLLKSFLARVNAELCIPKVVYDEALNRARKRIAAANSTIDALHRLTGGKEGFQKVNADDALHNYDESLKALLQDLGGEILPYPIVGHEELVRRALVPEKPFVEGGRGYRDALTWYSLLELARTEIREVVFVSANSTDFCEGEGIPSPQHAD